MQAGVRWVHCTAYTLQEILTRVRVVPVHTLLLAVHVAGSSILSHSNTATSTGLEQAKFMQ